MTMFPVVRRSNELRRMQQIQSALINIKHKTVMSLWLWKKWQTYLTFNVKCGTCPTPVQRIRRYCEVCGTKRGPKVRPRHWKGHEISFNFPPWLSKSKKIKQTFIIFLGHKIDCCSSLIFIQYFLQTETHDVFWKGHDLVSLLIVRTKKVGVNAIS